MGGCPIPACAGRVAGIVLADTAGRVGALEYVIEYAQAHGKEFV